MKAQLISFVVVVFLATQSAFSQQPVMQNYRPLGKARVNIFEAPKSDTIAFNGIHVRLGGAFTQQFQALDHSNQYTTDNANSDSPDEDLYLVGIRNGFNNAVANFNIDVQLADGVRLELITYLSSLHHRETYVKGGFIQFDKLPFINSSAVDNLMDYMTIKIGHMEINYGDGHFRRTDNGNAITNPFVGNYIMDAFDTEIGAEVYFQNSGFIGMVGVTEGEIKGSTKGTNQNSGAAVYGKAGFDKQLNQDLRLRVTGSIYNTEDAVNSNYLYSGDRTGTRYENMVQPMAAQSFRAGRYNPDFKNKITSIMINPFVKYQGLEFFGMYETSAGYKGTDDSKERRVNQMAGELIYRFMDNESFYLGSRYNRVFGELETQDIDAYIERYQISAGWFLTPNILAKLEYVNQKYVDFTAGTLLDNAKFNGVVFEAVVGF